VLSGGPIEKLKEILGYYSVVVTERYTHPGRACSQSGSWTPIPFDLRDGRTAKTEQRGDK